MILSEALSARQNRDKARYLDPSAPYTERVAFQRGYAIGRLELQDEREALERLELQQRSDDRSDAVFSLMVGAVVGALLALALEFFFRHAVSEALCRQAVTFIATSACATFS